MYYKKFLRTSAYVWVTTGFGIAAANSIGGIKFFSLDDGVSQGGPTVTQVVVDGHNMKLRNRDATGIRVVVTDPNKWQYDLSSGKTGPYSQWIHDPQCQNCRDSLDSVTRSVVCAYQTSGNTGWRYVRIPECGWSGQQPEVAIVEWSSELSWVRLEYMDRSTVSPGRNLSGSY